MRTGPAVAVGTDKGRHGVSSSAKFAHTPATLLAPGLTLGHTNPAKGRSAAAAARVPAHGAARTRFTTTHDRPFGTYSARGTHEAGVEKALCKGDPHAGGRQSARGVGFAARLPGLRCHRLPGLCHAG